MRVVVNHLKFTDAIPEAVVEPARERLRAIVEAGGLEARLVKVDERHAMLVLVFPDLETEERVKTEIGGPWMRQHIIPLLAGPTERSSGVVVADSD
jgi:hypothetical protein